METNIDPSKIKKIVINVDNYENACWYLNIKPKKFGKHSPFQGIYPIFEQLRIIVTAYNYLNNCGNIFIPNYDGRENYIASATYVKDRMNPNDGKIILQINKTEHLLGPLDLVFVRGDVGQECLKNHILLWYQWFSYNNIRNIYNQKL